MLNAIDPGQSHDMAQLDQLAAETRALSNELKQRIKALESAPPGPDAQMRKNRVRRASAVISPLDSIDTSSDRCCPVQIS